MPNDISVDISSIAPGETLTLNDIEFIAYGTDISNSIIGVMNKADGSTLCDFAIEFEMPVFGLEFDNQPIPGNEFQPSLLITNFTRGSYADVSIELLTLSDGATISANGSDQLFSLLPFSASTNEINYKNQ